MILYRKRNRKSADGAEVDLQPLGLIVQFLVLELCRTLLTCHLVLIAVGLLAVNAAVFDEAAGAALELDGAALAAAALPAAGAHVG